MHLEILVEEQSAEMALLHLIPKIIPDISFDIHSFQGKQALLKKLPDRLRGYKAWLPHDWYILVLIDRDDDNCYVLKDVLETIAHTAGFTTRTQNPTQFQVLNRIAIEELEAWFFGDVDALRAAYPSIPASLAQQAPFRDPDAIRGGTAEQLEKLLLKDHPGGLEKIRAADEIAQHMQPDKNRSKSFQVFRDTLQQWAAASQEADTKKYEE